MTEETEKTLTARKWDWLCCVMHDAIALVRTFEIARCTISRLDAKNGPRVRDSEKGALQRAAGLRSCSGRFWRVARQRQ